ncbi:MAG: Bug family tripartite tricarboxylate transporter substrate binding protein [Burkholderiales bacterium]
MNAKLKQSLVVVGVLSPALALAQAYPSKPIRMLVPFPAASVPDIIARQVMDKAGPPLGQPVIVENRVGAGGRIAAAAAAKSPADGYTLLLGSTSTHMVAPYIVKNMPYDSFQDFTPITNSSSSSTGVVVNAALPVNSIKELVDYAKKNPGKIAFGSNGIGSTHHLRGELIKMAAGIDMIHVPFGGSNELVTAVLSGTVPLTFITPGTVRPLIQAGKIRHIAMATPKRVPSLPNIPTVAEELPTYESIVDWFAFFGPGNLPRPIVNRLNAEMVKALNLPEVRSALEGQSLLVIGSTPDELAAQMKSDYAVYARVVKAAGIQPE